MIVKQASAHKFSIFNDLITNDHREFYEKIINELIGVSPICNQGKCTAAAISETATEQEQITELMERVETFAMELHDGTKNLFDQFYAAKEEFCRSIYCTTAYIKINLIDRTLLERTCDVRFWAIETVFVDSLERINKISRSLDTLLFEMGEYLDAAKAAFEVPTLETNWTMRDISQYVDDVRAFGARKKDLMFDHKVYEQFKEKVDALAEQLGKGKNQEATLKMLEKAIKSIEEVHQFVASACNRLEDVGASYTLYRDLVITLPDGTIVANAKPDRRAHVLGKSVYEEPWFQRASQPDSTMHYAIEKTEHSLVDDGNSLVFTVSLKSTVKADKIIGIMGAFFDLEEEARIILQDYMPIVVEGEAREGWFSFFTDRDGIIVGSSDPAISKSAPMHICHERTEN